MVYFIHQFDLHRNQCSAVYIIDFIYLFKNKVQFNSVSILIIAIYQRKKCCHFYTRIMIYIIITRV